MGTTKATKSATKKSTTKKTTTATKKNTKDSSKPAKQRSLVIVESPAKAKTINRYLGSDYVVRSSMGHLIDLPKSRMAIDIENNFEPEYITIRGRAKILNELKKEAKKSTEILLASDDDREGESIAWHIKNALEKNVKDTPIKRIVFHEITKDALLDAIKAPRDIDVSKVNAQKARRVLDRIVGYNLSPLLWEKIKRGLSAGRVQSVALRLIVEREDEIERFVPEEYWTYDVELKHKAKKFIAAFSKYDGNKVDFKKEADVQAIIDDINGEKYVVSNIETKERSRSPQAPYTTSKLQQAASTNLNFNSSKTMQVAQGLYEGVDINGEPTGLITYMRTDSVRISPVAQDAAARFIKATYGDEYIPATPPQYSVKKNAQDAHEAIRPTDVFLTPDKIKQYLKPEQYKLYKLIWERFVSSQMLPAKIESNKAIIKAGKAEFSVSSSKVKFEGFMKALTLAKDDKEKSFGMPSFSIGEECEFLEHIPLQHFTSPPPRFNDASLVKILEESAIGRPSTYAPTIRTIIARHYVERKGKQIVATELGKLVNELITDNFASLVDTKFTATMEENLDKVEEDSVVWNNVIGDFYPTFLNTVHQASENIKNMKNFFDSETDLVCEKCGSPMLKKLGRFGFFLACSNFPDCRNTKSISLGECPKCGGDITLKRSKRGREFYGCSKYPNCDFVSWDKPIEDKCPKCGKMMVEKTAKDKKTVYKCLSEDCSHEVEAVEQND